MIQAMDFAKVMYNITRLWLFDNQVPMARHYRLARCFNNGQNQCMPSDFRIEDLTRQFTKQPEQEVGPRRTR